MQKIIRALALVLGTCALVWAEAPAVRAGADTVTKPARFALESVDEVEALNAKPETATYQGRRAIHIANQYDGTATSADESMAILHGSQFRNGAIEVELAGMPRVGAPPDIRGFVGIAFRVEEKGRKFECFYLRMTNGRSDDQLRRNHSAQYVSMPGFPWEKLRADNPGAYESYVDLEMGAWTRVKILVDGTKAQLYVNGTAQPCLIVNDLKQGESGGAVALWIGDRTEAYFSNLTIAE